MKQKFFDLYEINRTTRCSLVVTNKQTKKKVFISHYAFNLLDRATDMREVEIERDGKTYTWVQVAIWQQ